MEALKVTTRIETLETLQQIAAENDQVRSWCNPEEHDMTKLRRLMPKFRQNAFGGDVGLVDGYSIEYWEQQVKLLQFVIDARVAFRFNKLSWVKPQPSEIAA